MSTNNVLLSSLLQPRTQTYSSALLNVLEEKTYYNSNLSQFACCKKIQVIVMRILSVLGACIASIRDLKVWICSTREIVALVGLKFHLANLISILAFPFLAMATMPFGVLPIQSYSQSLKGQAKLLDAFIQESQTGQLTVAEASKILARILRNRFVVKSNFLLEAVQKGRIEIIEAAFLMPFGNKEEVFCDVLKRSWNDKSTAPAVIATISSIYNRMEKKKYPVEARVLQESMSDLDEEAFDRWLSADVNPCEQYTEKSKMANTPFVHLILGLDSRERIIPMRTVEKVIRIAKKCVVLFGGFHKPGFDDVVLLIKHFNILLNDFRGGKFDGNPYLATLRRASFVTSNNAQEQEKFIKNFSEIQPYGDELQALQISCHMERYQTISDICTGLSNTDVKLILQYCLQHTLAGEDALEEHARPKIEEAQRASLQKIKEEDFAIQMRILTGLEPKQREYTGRRLMVKYAQMIDKDGVEMIIAQGIDPCATNPLKTKAKITAFEHLLLGVEDLKSYPMRKNPRSIENVVAIAKRCIECSGAFDKKLVDAVLRFKEYPWITSESLIRNELDQLNPYFRLLRHTKITSVYPDITELKSRISEIEPYLMELHLHQIISYKEKHKRIKEVCKIISIKDVRLVLQYALRYSDEGEKSIISDGMALVKTAPKRKATRTKGTPAIGKQTSSHGR